MRCPRLRAQPCSVRARASARSSVSEASCALWSQPVAHTASTLVPAAREAAARCAAVSSCRTCCSQPVAPRPAPTSGARAPLPAEHARISRRSRFLLSRSTCVSASDRQITCARSCRPAPAVGVRALASIIAMYPPPLVPLTLLLFPLPLFSIDAIRMHLTISCSTAKPSFPASLAPHPTTPALTPADAV